MRHLTTPLIALVLAAPLAAESRPDRDTRRASELVRQLGDPSYQVRESASRELVDLGVSAVDALRNGQEAASAEIRRRCGTLLHFILEADMQARIKKFLADPDSVDVGDLPGLTRFRGMAGEQKEARQLYAEMLREYGSLIGRVERTPEIAGEAYSDFMADLYQRHRQASSKGGQPISRGDAVTFLFLGTDPNAKQADIHYLHTSNALRTTPIRDAIRNNDGTSAVLKRMLIRWGTEQTNPSLINRVYGMALTGDLAEILPHALKLVKDKDALATTRAFALMAVGKFGSREHLSEVEPLFDSTSVLSQVNINGRRGSTQLGDVALAAAVHLRGKKIADFGFDMLRGELNFTTYYYLGFSDDEKRKAALEKYRREFPPEEK